MLKPILCLALALSAAQLCADDGAPAAPAPGNSAKSPTQAPGKALKMGDPAPELKLGKVYKGNPVTLEPDKTMGSSGISWHGRVFLEASAP